MGCTRRGEVESKVQKVGGIEGGAGRSKLCQGISGILEWFLTRKYFFLSRCEVDGMAGGEIV